METAKRTGIVARPNPGVTRPTGEETDAQLREMVIRNVDKCNAETGGTHCPFRVLRGLTSTTLKNTLLEMKRKALLELFDMACECRKTNNRLHRPRSAGRMAAPK